MISLSQWPAGDRQVTGSYLRASHVRNGRHFRGPRHDDDRLPHLEHPHNVRNLLMRKLQILDQRAETLGVQGEHFRIAIRSCPNSGGIRHSAQQAYFAEEVALDELPDDSVSSAGRAANDLAGAASQEIERVGRFTLPHDSLPGVIVPTLDSFRQACSLPGVERRQSKSEPVGDDTR